MIKILGRTFDDYNKAIKFLETTIKLEKNSKIAAQLKHKLNYLLVEKEIADEKKRDLQRAKRK
jgi:predicted secreted protein